jgi:exopolyphosphatase/guanosine-5'-triphosphate,3'-diphosphate pyrophosphatase
MVVVEVTDQMAFRVLSSEKDLTQLGEEALVNHYLSKRAMDYSLDVLGRYQRIAAGLECDVMLAYATSAVRESENGGDFVTLVRQQLKLPIQVISAEEEARLIYLAVRQAIDLSPDGKPALIVDIGGGSCEVIVGTNEHGMMLQSCKLGASRLTQQFIHHDPPSRRELESLEEHVDQTLRPLLDRALELGARRVIGTSGTMENLVAMCVQQHGEEVQRERVTTLMRRDEFKDLFRDLRHENAEARRKIPGLDAGRVPQIVAGATVVDFIFKMTDTSEM